MERVVARNDALPVKGDARKPPHDAARREHDVTRLERLKDRPVDQDLDHPGRGEPSETAHRGDAVPFQEPLDPLRHLVDDASFVGVHGVEVERDGSRPNAEPLAVARRVEHLGRVQHRFRRDAPPMQARSARRRVLLHERGPESELRRADRRHVPARPAADHDDVI